MPGNFNWFACTFLGATPAVVECEGWEVPKSILQKLHMELIMRHCHYQKVLKWLLDRKHVAALHFQDSEWATARWKEASDERFGAGHHDISIHFLRTGGSHEDIQNHSEPQKSMGYKIMFQFFKWSAGCRLGAIEATPSNNSHSSLGLRNKAIDNWVAFVAM